MEDLTKDLQEIEGLLSKSTRPRVQAVLSSLREQIKLEQVNLPTPAEKPAQSQDSKPVPQTPSVVFEEIKKYSWSDEGANVKLYITLEGVGKLPQESVSFEFSSQSFDLKIFGLQSKNLRLAISKLFAPIVAEKATCRVKADSIVLTLPKGKDKATWSKIIFDEKSAIDSSPKAKSDDPNAALTDMMRKLYDEGDYNMKRMIGEALTSARNKKP